MASAVWSQWTTGTSITTGSYQSAVWNTWTTGGTASYTVSGQNVVWNGWYQDQETLDELQARREQASRERLARMQEEQERHDLAKSNALGLLLELLDPEEREIWVDLNLIEVIGQDGQRYRIETHRDTVHGNIVRLDEHGCILGRACVAPGMYGEAGALPTADGWVGQYLGLRFDTQRFLSHANWSGARLCRQHPEAPEMAA